MSLILAAVSGAALSLLLIAERLAPAHHASEGTARLWRNAMLGLFGLGMSFLVVTPLSLAAAEIGPPWRSDWPFVWRFLGDIVLLEFFLYWWHRANHEIPFLWRFHGVHHYDEFLDVSSAVRFHPGELAMSAILRASYVLLTDVSAMSILVFDATVLIAAAFHHSNIALPQSWDRLLRRVVVTPEHHRIHHRPGRYYTDSNYGTLSTVFDRLFGSWRDAAPRDPDRRYGVDGVREKRFPALLTAPFRSRGG
ncbi:MAG: sterol desaturase family protein [Parvularcula sp.]|jgi:sterol desaturase/sphingolipid hydroxylase (fatty acid hydroxylase superfamily)|nr:sterol desaturase family protein [Parvularcula sp.]